MTKFDFREGPVRQRLADNGCPNGLWRAHVESPGSKGGAFSSRSSMRGHARDLKIPEIPEVPATSQRVMRLCVGDGWGAFFFLRRIVGKPLIRLSPTTTP